MDATRQAAAPDSFLIACDRLTTRIMIELGSVRVQSLETLGIVLRELNRRGLVEIVKGTAENVTSATLFRLYVIDSDAPEGTRE